jgi:hypothetical protein
LPASLPIGLNKISLITIFGEDEDGGGEEDKDGGGDEDDGGIELKVAVTDTLVAIKIRQSPAPLQPPDQPLKIELAEGVAVRVTVVLVVKSSESSRQLSPQLIPAGSLVITPTPSPDLNKLKE